MPTTRRKIVVVDDDPSVLRLLEQTLRGDGWDVDTVSTAAEAVASFYLHEPDAAVIDIALGESDGFVLARRLRDMFPGLPVLLISSEVEAQLATRVYLGTPQPSFLAKPIDTEALRRIVRKIAG